MERARAIDRVKTASVVASFDSAKYKQPNLTEGRVEPLPYRRAI